MKNTPQILAYSKCVTSIVLQICIYDGLNGGAANTVKNFTISRCTLNFSSAQLTKISIHVLLFKNSQQQQIL